MRKGFTLTELLGVLLLVGFLIILIMPPIINGISNREEATAMFKKL